MKLPFDGCPYALSATSEAIFLEQIQGIEERVTLLRGAGKLTPETLKRYYGDKRFEQVAESNAIEGSTLGVGETEMAVLKGVTLTGHDPAFVRDAVSLDAALTRTAEIAKCETATDIAQLHEIHSLIMGERPGGGVFRSEPVRIRGAAHVPPRTWAEVMDQMEHWENWSKKNFDAPPPLRAAVLHAWLSHIHPYIDGNGRTARAISNLELIRAGYPPLIIRKKERSRYIDALSQSDEAGDIASFLDLLMERTQGAFDGLARAASEKQGFDPITQAIRQKQNLRMEVWRQSVSLFSSRLELKISEKLSETVAQVNFSHFDGVVDLDDFIALCDNRSVGRSWAFRISVRIAGFGRFSYLSFVGHRSYEMNGHLKSNGGPSLYWSIYDESHERKWRQVSEEAPFFKEATIDLDNGDSWTAVTSNGAISDFSTVDLADRVATDLVQRIAAQI